MLKTRIGVQVDFFLQREEVDGMTLMREEETKQKMCRKNIYVEKVRTVGFPHGLFP